ncbi:MAG: hypothetical protein M1824_004594 [Vezdaea acicularis]|nr:MAG: hypothetical protein M1824_004594 [Vezdaea acicularis]
MVKHDNFKTCNQSGFCKRNRDYADKVHNYGPSWNSPYKVEQFRLERGQLGGTILKTTGKGGETVRLPLTITFLKSGVARVTIDEEKRQKGEIELRHGSQARKERYSEAQDWVIAGKIDLSEDVTFSKDNEPGYTKILYGPNHKFEAKIRHEPFSIEFKRDGETQIKFNDRGLMNVEHWRPKIEKAAQEGEEAPAETEEDESTWWEESFGGNQDTKPRGPEAVALDISFPQYEHVFGIPEHAGPLSLKETRGGDGNYNDPYRLYNADVFEYEVDSPMTLYGAIPFMQAHRKDSTVGVFWLNAAETWIDIVKSKKSTNPLSLGNKGKTETQTHWISESGIMDVFVFLGPTPKDVTKAYGSLTGFTEMPQEFSLGYHQCRWNYFTEDATKEVDRKMDKFALPYDVIWLDIEYTDGKKYFTWHPLAFKDPLSIQKQLDKRNRKLVLIIDPHIKNEGDYPVVDALKSKDLGVHNKDGAIYEGHCWPGSSHWIDCFNPAALSWWASLFQYSSFKGTTPSTFIWNDMNEPSVFNGPETTMPKDNLHHGNWEHRDVHNLNGLTYHLATHDALISRKKGEPNRRPFVLTRSFFAGSQRLGAVWTGDNLASWDHLAASFPMLLSLGVSGYPFAGADVPGFFGNPTKELLTRWYQAGAFYPFFRGHAHVDTQRREPYLVGEPYLPIVSAALKLRYALLPAWYTAFHEASVEGNPIIRPMYWVHPSIEHGFGLDDQFYIGSTGLLAKPVTAEGVETIDIYLPDDEVYYDYFDYKTYAGHGLHIMHAPLAKIPLLARGGHIIPRRDRARRSSGLMKWDPFTLVVVLANNGSAEGTLYLDDGESYEFQNGAYIHRKFVFDPQKGTLRSEDLFEGAKTKEAEKYLKLMKQVRVEKVVFVGAPRTWSEKTKVGVREEGEKERKVKFTFNEGTEGRASWAVVRDPAVAIGRSWTISV